MISDGADKEDVLISFIREIYLFGYCRERDRYGWWKVQFWLCVLIWLLTFSILLQTIEILMLLSV